MKCSPSRSGVSRVVWRARSQDRSTLGPSRVRVTEPLQATALPRDGPPLSLRALAPITTRWMGKAHQPGKCRTRHSMAAADRAGEADHTGRDTRRRRRPHRGAPPRSGALLQRGPRAPPPPSGVRPGCDPPILPGPPPGPTTVFTIGNQLSGPITPRRHDGSAVEPGLENHVAERVLPRGAHEHVRHTEERPWVLNPARPPHVLVDSQLECAFFGDAPVTRRSTWT